MSLLEEFRNFPSALTIYLAVQMWDAIRDDPLRPCDAASDFHERFIAWAHSGPEPDTSLAR
ncbi:hypothetical protein GCM10009828_067990 [Actinoplanes couchii]|uniref:Uncharacterized protein n=1 Tax=Actinoplanes couchii TaxID=403638 RepID=A0ABQ3XTY5_9ACTN|nr:hypothetical protein Aco03nite_103640 [Actinoplanes couchii]